MIYFLECYECSILLQIPQLPKNGWWYFVWVLYLCVLKKTSQNGHDPIKIKYAWSKLISLTEG